MAISANGQNSGSGFSWGRGHLARATLLILAMGLLSLLPFEARSEGETEDDQKHVDIQFEGRHDLSARTLKRVAAREIDALRGGQVKQSYADDAAYWMQQAYRRKGYDKAQVSYRIEPHKDSTRVIFEIEVGPRIRWAGATFSGNERVKASSLERFFKQGGQGRKQGILRRRPAFVRSQVENGVVALSEYYQSLGYLDVKVSRPEVQIDEARREARVHLEIDEGVCWRLQGILYEGDVLDEAVPKLEKIRQDMTGLPYQNRQELILRNRIVEAYTDLGYPDVKAAISCRREQDKGEAFLSATLSSGEKVRVGQVRVEGQRKTRASFIERHIRLKPGDLSCAAKERETAQALYETGVFSEVHVGLEGEDPHTRDLVIKVVDASSLEAYVEPGWGSYEEARMVAGVREKNLLGYALSLGMEGKASMMHRSLEATLADPELWGQEVSGQLDGNVVWREEPAYTRNDVGLDLTFGRSWSDVIFLSAGGGLRRIDLSDVEDEGLSSNDEDGYNRGSVEFQGTWDTRDDVFMSRSGQRSTVAVEYVSPILAGEVQMLKLTAGLRVFRALTSSTVLAFRGNTGLIVPGVDATDVPISERFFNGGENTVRSFNEAELGPLDQSGDPMGGLGYTVLSLELRQKLLQSLSASLFCDLGNVAPNRSPWERGQAPYTSSGELLSDTLSDFYRDFKPALGVGLLYNLPIGPARIDMAINPIPDDDRNEDSFVIHVSIGTAF